MATFQVKVNGQVHSVDVLRDTPLLWVLRDELGLTGTKYGCGIAQCGACTVFLMANCCALRVPRVVLGDGDHHRMNNGLEAAMHAFGRTTCPQCGYQLARSGVPSRFKEERADRQRYRPPRTQHRRCATYGAFAPPSRRGATLGLDP
jgi:hypothetical protein